MGHTCNNNGNHLLNTEEEADVASVYYINATTYIYMNYDDNFIDKYYTPFFC